MTVDEDWDRLRDLVVNGGATNAAARTLASLKVSADRAQELMSLGVPAQALVDVVNYGVPDALLPLAHGQDWTHWRVFARAYFTLRRATRDWHDLLGPNWATINVLAQRGFPLEQARAVHAHDVTLAASLDTLLHLFDTRDLDLPAEEIVPWARAGAIRVFPPGSKGSTVHLDQERIRLWRNTFGVRGALYLAAGLTMTEAQEADRTGIWTDPMLASLAGLRQHAPA